MRPTHVKAIFFTSLFWIVLDGFLLIYFTDCVSKKCNEQKQQAAQVDKNLANKPIGIQKRNDINPRDDDDEIDDDTDVKNKRRRFRVDFDHLGEKKNELLKDLDYNLAKEVDVNDNHFFTSTSTSSSTSASSTSTRTTAKREAFNSQPITALTTQKANNLFGELGQGVVVPQSLKALARKRFSENEFDVVASELIALNRSLQDVRHQKYPFICESAFFHLLIQFKFNLIFI